MELDFEACYEAIASRDRNFDGRFFTGVLSTGIYCRPICPARLPGRNRVRFFRVAAAAEEAGFRPCRRCFPHRSPGSPEWDWRRDLVGRALRLISEGVADHEGIPGVAHRLGVSERHLRRLFVAELGAAPGAVARTHRAQLARRLIEESSLSLSDVALASGFTSLRRFNTTVKEVFQQTPSEIRGARRSRSSGAGCRLTLGYREPFAGTELMAFLRARAIPGVEEVIGDTYRRTFMIEGSGGIAEIRLGADSNVILDVQLDTVSSLTSVVRRTRHLFDLDADPQAVETHLGRDPRLRPLLKARPGLRVPGAFDGFEAAVRAVLGQQVSVRAATTLAGRLVERFGQPLEHPSGSLTHRFPDPGELAEADVATIGLPGKRATTIRTLATAVANGELPLDGTGDDEEVRERLTRIPGIGPWTVSYISMKILRDPDAFPAADLGVRQAMQKLGIDENSERSERWRPWRAYATIYLWSGLT